MNGYKDPKVHVIGGEMSDEEIKLYIQRAHELHPGTAQLELKIDGDYVDIRYDIAGIERICRITGYLTTTVDKWNDAKQAELKDRVKHGMVGIE